MDNNATVTTDSLSPGAIAGIIAGIAVAAILLLAVLFAALYFLYKKQRRVGQDASARRARANTKRASHAANSGVARRGSRGRLARLTLASATSSEQSRVEDEKQVSPLSPAREKGPLHVRHESTGTDSMAVRSRDSTVINVPPTAAVAAAGHAKLPFRETPDKSSGLRASSTASTMHDTVTIGDAASKRVDSMDSSRGGSSTWRSSFGMVAASRAMKLSTSTRTTRSGVTGSAAAAASTGGAAATERDSTVSSDVGSVMALTVPDAHHVVDVPQASLLSMGEPSVHPIAVAEEETESDARADASQAAQRGAPPPPPPPQTQRRLSTRERAMALLRGNLLGGGGGSPNGGGGCGGRASSGTTPRAIETPQRGAGASQPRSAETAVGTNASPAAAVLAPDARARGVIVDMNPTAAETNVESVGASASRHHPIDMLAHDATVESSASPPPHGSTAVAPPLTAGTAPPTSSTAAGGAAALDASASSPLASPAVSASSESSTTPSGLSESSSAIMSKMPPPAKSPTPPMAAAATTSSEASSSSSEEEAEEASEQATPRRLKSVREVGSQLKETWWSSGGGGGERGDGGGSGIAL